MKHRGGWKKRTQIKDLGQVLDVSLPPFHPSPPTCHWAATSNLGHIKYSYFCVKSLVLEWVELAVRQGDKGWDHANYMAQPVRS